MKCGEARLIMVAFVSTPKVLFSRFDTLARSGTVGLGYELFRFQVGRWTWESERGRVWERQKPERSPREGIKLVAYFFLG
jgi:hypothetical protein